MAFGRFGEHLAILRNTAGIPRSVLARELKISAVYLAQVEKAHQLPLRHDLIDKAALLVSSCPGDAESNAETLHRLAIEDRKEITLEVNTQDTLGQLRVARLLRREWSRLSPETYYKLIVALEENPTTIKDKTP